MKFQKVFVRNEPWGLPTNRPPEDFISVCPVRMIIHGSKQGEIEESCNVGYFGVPVMLEDGIVVDSARLPGDAVQEHPVTVTAERLLESIRSVRSSSADPASLTYSGAGPASEGSLQQSEDVHYYPVSVTNPEHLDGNEALTGTRNKLNLHYLYSLWNLSRHTWQAFADDSAVWGVTVSDNFGNYRPQTRLHSIHLLAFSCLLLKNCKNLLKLQESGCYDGLVRLMFSSLLDYR